MHASKRKPAKLLVVLLIVLGLLGLGYWALLSNQVKLGPSLAAEPSAEHSEKIARPGPPGSEQPSVASGGGKALPTSEIAFHRSEALRAERQARAAAPNDRVYAHGVLGAPSPVALRVALEVENDCIGSNLASAVLDDPSRVHPDLLPKVQRLQQRCAAGSSLTEDRQMRGALRAAALQRRGSEPLLDLYLERGDPSFATLERLIQAVRLDDGDSALLIASIMAADPSKRQQLVGGDPLLNSSTSVAWGRAICSVASCQEDSLRVAQCLVHQLCSQGSYAEQLDALAARSGQQAMQAWRRAVPALEQRARALRDTGH